MVVLKTHHVLDLLTTRGRSPQAVDAAESSALWHRTIWRHNETLGHTNRQYEHEGRLTQSVQHVVVDCVMHKAPDGFC